MANIIYAGGDLYTTPPLRRENPAGAAGILPGHIVVISSGEHVVHATQGVRQDYAIADKQYLTDVTEAYADGETVGAWEPRQGDRFYVRMKTGQALVAGVTALTMAGSGRLEIAASGDTIVAYAAQTVTTAANDELALVKLAEGGTVA